MEQLIQVTAAFSNAVFMVMLTNVSDFTRRLDLPIPQPVTASQVAEFRTYPSTNIIGGLMTLTNGDRFYQNMPNCIDGYRAYSNYFNPPDDWVSHGDSFKLTNFLGTVNMTTNELVGFARDTLRRLGYGLKLLQADGPPTSLDDPDIDPDTGREYPYFRIAWLPQGSGNIIAVGVNAETKKVVEYRFMRSNAPPFLPAGPRPPSPLQQMIHVTPAFSNAVLMVVLTNVADFAKRLELPIPQPVNASQVAKFIVAPTTNFIGGTLTLTNGDLFGFGNGYVDYYLAYSNYYNLPPDWQYPRDRFKTLAFLGRMNMTTNEVVEFARSALRKLGYDPKVLHADGPPTRFDGPGFYEATGELFPYCTVEWQKPAEERGPFYTTEIRINAEQKRIVGVAIISRNANRPNALITVPVEREVDYRKRIEGKMFLRTNAPPSFSPEKPE
jgi:hypothetical protein